MSVRLSYPMRLFAGVVTVGLFTSPIAAQGHSGRHAGACPQATDTSGFEQVVRLPGARRCSIRRSTSRVSP